MDTEATAVKKSKVPARGTDARKEYDRVAKQISREREKGLLPGSDDESLANRKAQLVLESTWEANLTKATREERIQIGEWTLVTESMEVALQVLDQPTTDWEDEALLKEIATEVDEYVRRFPPSKDLLYVRIQNSSAKHVGYAEIQQRIKNKDFPPLMSKFGIPADSIHATIYSHFVSKVRDRRNKNRAAEPALAPPLTEAEQNQIKREALIQRREEGHEG